MKTTSAKPQAPAPPRGPCPGTTFVHPKKSRTPCYARLFGFFRVDVPRPKSPYGGGRSTPPHRSGRKPLRRNGSRAFQGGHTCPCTRPPEAGLPALARAGMVYPPAQRAGLSLTGPSGRDRVRPGGYHPSRQVVYRRPWPAHQRGPRGHAAGPRPAAGPAGG